MGRSGATVIVRRTSPRTLVRYLLACALVLACLLPFAATAPAASRDGDSQPAQRTGYQAAAFSFEVTIKDDGEDEGGGWQEATARLVFTRPRPADKDSCSPGGTHEVWRCPLTVGMPVRTSKIKISKAMAADKSADAATAAAKAVTREKDETEAKFCTRFRTKMEVLLNSPTQIGARVAQPK